MGVRQSAVIPRSKTRGLRWRVIAVLSGGQFLAEMDRAALAAVVPLVAADLHSSHVEMGLILAAFFWSYSPCQLPAGWLVDRIGIRLLFPAAVALWSAINASTIFAASIPVLIAIRLGLGIAESPLQATTITVTAQWFPKQERATATAIYDVTGRLGVAVALPVMATLATLYNWRVAFLFVGLIGLLWIPFWVAIYRRPQDHPQLGTAELAHIAAGDARIDMPGRGEVEPVPWLSLFRYRTVWGLAISVFCKGVAGSWFITWFPSYLVEARHFTVLKAGFAGAVPLGAGILGALVGGPLSDYLIRRGYSLTFARKSVIVGGMAIGTVIAFSTFVASPFWVILLMAISYFGINSNQGAVWSIPAEVAPTPRNVASVASIQNVGAQAAYFVFPIFVGVAVGYSHDSYTIPLLAAAGMLVVGILCYLFMVGRIEPLPVRR